MGKSEDEFEESIIKHAQSRDRKKTKDEANYRQSDGDEKCGTCKHFNHVQGRKGTCEVVEGEIKKGYTSDLYEPE